MRELFDALTLLAEVIGALSLRAQLVLGLIVLALGVLGAGVVNLTATVAGWCWRAVRRRRPPAGPVAASPPSASVLDDLTLGDDWDRPGSSRRP